MVGDKIQTTITSMTISKKNADLRLKFYFMSCVRVKKGEAFASKNSEKRIIKRL